MTSLQGTQRNIRDMSLRREDGPAHAADAPVLQGRELAELALAIGLEKKALEPMLLDVRELCSYTDYILLLSARSDRQVAAVTDFIVNELKLRGQRPFGSEGEGSGQWALIDYGDAVVHVFHHPSREFYDLESLWVDAPRVELEVPREARIDPGEPVY